jgi:CDP-diacylglycerol--glycerol-3-phosphate 3-phosphatidyltransferase
MVLVLILVEGSPFWVDVLVYATVAITVISAADYFFGFRALFHARPSSHSRAET